MINRIELKNFMSHADTVIEPARGLTVLIGPNNCGKSAVVAALQILSHNDNSTYVLRHEEKKCRVSVTTDEGDTIVWRRGKTGGPAYEINGTTFDRLKGAGQPEVLETTLRLPKVQCDRDDVDIHFGEQKSPVFLVRDSARTAADFFASSSDAGRMMKMQSLHKQKLRDAKKELKACSEEWSEAQLDIEVLEGVPGLKREYENLDELSTSLDKLAVATQELGGLIQEIRDQTLTLNLLGKKASALGSLTALPQMGPVDPLSGLVSELRSEAFLLERLQSQSTAISELLPPPAMAAAHELSDLIHQLHRVSYEFRYRTEASTVLGAVTPVPELSDTSTLQIEMKALQGCLSESERLAIEAEQAEKNLEAAKLAIVQWADRNPRCPTCDHLIESDHWFTHTHQSSSEKADG